MWIPDIGSYRASLKLCSAHVFFLCPEQLSFNPDTLVGKVVSELKELGYHPLPDGAMRGIVNTKVKMPKRRAYVAVPTVSGAILYLKIDQGGLARSLALDHFLLVGMVEKAGYVVAVTR